MMQLFFDIMYIRICATFSRRKSVAQFAQANEKRIAMKEGNLPAIAETQTSFLLYVCAKEIIRQYSVYLDEFGLTYTQYIAMLIIWDKKEISVSALGKELFLDSGTLTPLLKKLEAKGFVARTRSKEDERKVIISATKEGAALKEKVAHIPGLIGSRIYVDNNDVAVLQEMIQRLMTQIMEAGKDIKLKR